MLKITVVITHSQESEKEQERLTEINNLSAQNAELQRQIQTLKVEAESVKRSKNSAEKKLSEAKKKLKELEVSELEYNSLI